MSGAGQCGGRLACSGSTRSASGLARRSAGELADRIPGGHPLHGLLELERAAILALFEAWGEIDRSHRKLAHRGFRLGLVHVSESTVRRVLAAEGLVLPGRPRCEPVPRTPWPDWLGWKPNRMWAYDFTHFTRARRAALAIIDVVSRRWIHTLVCAEESSIQVEVAFTAALAAEDLLDAADARATQALGQALLSGDRDRVTSLTEGGIVPLLLAISDNGPQMRSHSTREFLAGIAIAQQFGRPHTPEDQASESRIPGRALRARPTDEPAASSQQPCCCRPGAGQPTKNERPHPSRHPDRHLVAGPCGGAEHPNKQGRPTHLRQPRTQADTDRSDHEPPLIGNRSSSKPAMLRQAGVDVQALAAATRSG